MGLGSAFIPDSTSTRHLAAPRNLLLGNDPANRLRTILRLFCLYALEQPTLEGLFGRYGVRLYQLARGIDLNPVVPNRASKSISAEDTFEHDISLTETEPLIRGLAEKVWKASRRNARAARTVVLKLKTKEFNVLTRSHTPAAAPSTCQELIDVALSLLHNRIDLGPQQLYRLAGVGLSNFQITIDSPQCYSAPGSSQQELM